VNHPSFVRRRQALGHGRPYFGCSLPTDAAHRDAATQRLTTKQFGDGVGNSLIGAEVVDGEDVWMIQLGDSLCFALETCETIGVLSQSLMEHLDCHVPVEPLVVGAVDHPHPAGTDLFDDAVVAECGADQSITP